MSGTKRSVILELLKKHKDLSEQALIEQVHSTPSGVLSAVQSLRRRGFNIKQEDGLYKLRSGKYSISSRKRQPEKKQKQSKRRKKYFKGAKDAILAILKGAAPEKVSSDSIVKQLGISVSCLYNSVMFLRKQGIPIQQKDRCYFLPANFDQGTGSTTALAKKPRATSPETVPPGYVVAIPLPNLFQDLPLEEIKRMPVADRMRLYDLMRQEAQTTFSVSTLIHANRMVEEFMKKVGDGRAS